RAMPPGGDDDILPPIPPAIGHRRRLRARRQARLPQHLSALQIIGAQILIGRRPDEHQSRGGDDRAA
ncbi:hypothetical protein LTR94_036021, partial [Friedmanniomyces endolithicus]